MNTGVWRPISRPLDARDSRHPNSWATAGLQMRGAEASTRRSLWRLDFGSSSPAAEGRTVWVARPIRLARYHGMSPAMSSKLTACVTVPCQAIGKCPRNQGPPRLACLEGRVRQVCRSIVWMSRNVGENSVVVLAHALQGAASVLAGAARPPEAVTDGSEATAT